MDIINYYNKKITDTEILKFISDRPSLPDSPKSFHIVGVCGTAMGQLAGLLKDSGFKVSGSDQQCYPPVSTMVESLGIDLHIGNFQKENISNADVVVVGNVVRSHNPETSYARKENIPQASLPETLAKYVFQNARRLVVAGTHGKTTTTGLLAHIFEVAGKEPGYMIGGVPQGKDEGYKLGSGQYAIFEGDEYDTSYFDKRPKFLHYGASSAIITSLELDHMDIYDSFDSYKQAFIFFVEDLPEDGHLFLSDTYGLFRDFTKYTKAKVHFYGAEKESDVYYENLRQEGEFQVFDFIFKGEMLGTIKTQLSGEHNVFDILGAASLAYAEGIAFADIKKAVATFKGMKRRQEIIAEVNGATIIDDFAHHPTAVNVTVAGIKTKYPKKRLIAIFEPSTRSSRKKIFEEEYIKAFDTADFVCIQMPKLGNGEITEECINLDYITSEISKRGPQVQSYNKTEELLDDIVPNIKKGDVVLVMSHGEFDKIREKLIKRLG